jgi:Uma2 family endonuclease
MELSRRPFTVHDYHRMAEAGILSEGDRVELIRGEILAMSPIGSPHNGAVIRANNFLARLVGVRALVAVQGAIRLSDYDEPQPDIFLLRPREDCYTRNHPGAEDIFLIVEVADSSLEYDQTVKAELYAAAGVAEYWIADIANDRIRTFADPEGGLYRTTGEFHRGESRTPRLLPGCAISAASLLP